MKRLIYLLPVLFIASCNGQFNAAYGGGLWFIPLVLGGFAVYTWLRYTKGIKSPLNDDDGTTPKKSTGTLVFAIGLTIACIGSAIWMWVNRAVV